LKIEKYIDKSDLTNKEIISLPIRRGCLGPCACLGFCKEIFGYVDRNEYEEFIKNMITLDDFLISKCE